MTKETSKTKFNLMSVADTNMQFNDAGLYVSGFTFDIDTGYNYQVSADQSKEVFRCDFADLQFMLTAEVTHLQASVDHVTFTKNNNVAENDIHIKEFMELSDDHEMIISHIDTNTFLLKENI